MGLHLTNKNSSELIHNVIMQSNPFGIPMKNQIEEQGSPNFFAKFPTLRAQESDLNGDLFKGENSSGFVC